MAKKIWPKILLGVAAAGVVGGVAYLVSAVDRNLHKYMTREEYDAAATLPEDSKIVVVAFDPSAMLASNVEELVSKAAEQHSDYHFIMVSREIGDEQLGMEIDGWGAIDAGAPDGQVFHSNWGPQTNAAEIEADLAQAVVLLSATQLIQEPEIETAGLDVAE